MTDPLLQPLRGVAIYNPGLLSKEELKQQFVARTALLQRLMVDLRAESDDETPQHRLIVGARGMGKTILLRRLSYAIEDDPPLSRRWLPLTFPEEQYNLIRLSDLWVNVLDALGDALDRAGQHAKAEALDVAILGMSGMEEERRAPEALNLIIAKIGELGKGLVLFMDNLDLILDRLKAQEWTIREVLSETPGLLLIGASSTAMESTYHYDAAFYDFFETHELRGLSEAEMTVVLRRLAQLDGVPGVEELLKSDPARISALHTLTGGNPRTVVLLFGILASGPDGDVRNDLERLLDQCTPLYKARFEELPVQSQQILDAVALNWYPLSAAELAVRVRMEINKVSAQLNRLTRQGVIEKVAYYPGKKTGFQIAERFYNIWYLMRASRRVRRRLIWLVEFLKLFYSGEQLAVQAKRFLHAAGSSSPTARIRRAEYAFSLSRAITDTPLRSALEHTALHSILDHRELRRQAAEIIDLDGEDDGLKPRAERIRLLADAREAVLRADIERFGLSAEEFWDLLGGTPSLSIPEKARIAATLEAVPYGGMDRFVRWLRAQVREFKLSIEDARTLLCLRTAIREGEMTGLDDVEWARTAAARHDAPELVPIVLALRLQRAFDQKLFQEVETAVQSSTSPDAWRFYGNLLRNSLHQYDQAEQAYRRAIELGPECAYPWNSLGTLLGQLGRIEEAEKALSQATDIDPSYAPPWTNLGILLCEEDPGRYEEAERAFRHAIKLEPANDGAWCNLSGLLQDHLGCYAEAEDAYNRAIEINPDCVHHWNNLGCLLEDHLGRYDEAERAYRRAIELAPDDHQSWNNLGALLFNKLGHYDDAEKVYRRAIELDPTCAFPYPWYNLGILLVDKLGRAPEAEGILRKALELRLDDQYTRLLLAYVMIKQNDIQAAEVLLKELIAGWTHETPVLYWQGLIGVFREMISADYVIPAVELLTETGVGEHWLPFKEALNTIQAGSPDYLKRVAPEVRVPAKKLLEYIAPEFDWA